MARRPERAALALLLGALVVAALLGRATAPDRSQNDPRRSSLLAGPAGARGLAEALRRLGVPVEARRRSLQHVDSLPPSSLLALLDIREKLTRLEIVSVRRYVARGGDLLLAGPSNLGACFGVGVASTGRALLPVTRPVASWTLPATGALLEATERAGECAPLGTARVDTLLRTPGGRPAALRLVYGGGGRVTLLADAVYVCNRALRETDAGLAVLPWILGDHPSRVVFDEYHQGFGEQGSLVVAAARWAAGAPAGWAMVQLAGAGLALLALSAVRFGATAGGVTRLRRSPDEHLEALANGLERGDGAGEAVALIVAGLRHRLGRASPTGPAPVEAEAWLEALARSAHGEPVRHAIGRLIALTHQRADADRVLDVGNAAEDVWTALRQEKTRQRS
jgi:hypothetical protein